MRQPAAITPTLRVAVLWLLVGALFVAFNLAYWPLHYRQLALAPENFLGQAERYLVQGAPDQALAHLRRGIEELHPPYAAPYTALLSWLRESGAGAGAEYYLAVEQFYLGLEKTGAARDDGVGAAVALMHALMTAPLLAPETEKAITILSDDAAASQRLSDPLPGPGAALRLAYLQLLGGGITLDGQVGATGTLAPVSILVQSTGGAGPLLPLHILVDGKEFGHQARGFSVALVEPGEGHVFQSGNFDTWESAEHAARMQAMLDEAPPGTIAALAVRDDGAGNMTPGLAAALEAYGFAAEARVNRERALFGARYSFAGIGVKGAGPGTAQQAWSPASLNGVAGHTVVCGVIPAVEAAP